MFLHPSFQHWASIQQKTKTTLLIIYLTPVKTIRVLLGYSGPAVSLAEYKAVLSLYCVSLSVTGGSGGFRGLQFSSSLQHKTRTAVASLPPPSFHLLPPVVGYGPGSHYSNRGSLASFVSFCGFIFQCLGLLHMLTPHTDVTSPYKPMLHNDHEIL